MAADSADHYDRVTDAWREFMGENLHFGYFERPDTGLAEATDLLIEKMLALCDISAESRVLDVGCGVGGPALYLHERCGCSVEGISTSERGVRIASEKARERGYEKVRFSVADGVDNGFPDRAFDVVWIMESSHPIQDKAALFRECHRVLEEGGVLVLCDLVQAGTLPLLKGLWRFLANLRGFFSGMDVWGPAQILTLGALCDRLIEAGFERVRLLDITEKVIPTLKHWSENALRFLDAREGEAEREYADRFIVACHNLENAFREGLMGYGMLRAEKRPG